MVTGQGYPYGCPYPLTIHTDIRTDVRADIRVELPVLRTLRPGASLRSGSRRIVEHKRTTRTRLQSPSSYRERQLEGRSSRGSNCFGSFFVSVRGIVREWRQCRCLLPAQRHPAENTQTHHFTHTPQRKGRSYALKSPGMVPMQTQKLKTNDMRSFGFSLHRQAEAIFFAVL